MAEEKELTDSQLLDVARQIEHELKFKANAAEGLRQYVQIKQKLASSKQALADHEKLMASNREILSKAILAHQSRLAELDSDYTMKRAVKETEFEDFGVRLGKEIEDLKATKARYEQEVAAAEKQSQEEIKQIAADQKTKVAALTKAEKDKVARNEALDSEFKVLQQAIQELKAKHGLL